MKFTYNTLIPLYLVFNTHHDTTQKSLKYSHRTLKIFNVTQLKAPSKPCPGR